jgi:hypothetical protein
MKRRKYTAPKIEIIGLDREISLALNSLPPFGPDELTQNTVPTYFNNNQNLI